MQPLPEGLFDKLAQQGAELLTSWDAWKPLDKHHAFPLFTRPSRRKGEPCLCAGEGIIPYPIDQVVDSMVCKMPANSPRWDKVCRGVEVIHKWSDTDFLYRYIIDPGPLLAHRDMIYYEGWRQAPNGQVVNVSASIDGPCELPRGWVRMHILLHYKRFTPLEGGRATRYETIQQMDLRGWVPHWLTTGAVARGLRTEYDGYIKIIQEDQKKRVLQGDGSASAS